MKETVLQSAAVHVSFVLLRRSVLPFLPSLCARQHSCDREGARWKESGFLAWLWPFLFLLIHLFKNEKTLKREVPRISSRCKNGGIDGVCPFCSCSRGEIQATVRWHGLSCVHYGSFAIVGDCATLGDLSKFSWKSICGLDWPTLFFSSSAEVSPTVVLWLFFSTVFPVYLRRAYWEWILVKAGGCIILWAGEVCRGGRWSLKTQHPPKKDKLRNELCCLYSGRLCASSVRWRAHYSSRK